MNIATYTRVSSDDQIGNFSIDAQARACRDYAERRGWVIVREYVEEGRSAKGRDTRTRPQFHAMLQAADRREFDVILVHKMDRFARNQSVLWDSLERLGKANVALASVSEEIDYTTPSGRLFMTMIGGIAEFYSGNLATETKKGKAERRAQGLYNGVLPFGYKRAAERAEALVDDVASAGVRMAFDLAAAGKTARQIAEALNAAGYRTSGNRGRNPWTRDSVRVLVANRFYLGELPGEVPGKHDPLVTAEAFDLAQRAVSERAYTRGPACVNSHGRTYSLTGLLTCGKCGSHLNLWSDASGLVQRAYCSRRRQRADCDQPTVRLDVIEAQVEEWIDGLLAAEADGTASAERLRRDAAEPGDIDAARRRVTATFERAKKLYLLGDMTDEEYQSAREAARRELAALPISPEAVRHDYERIAKLARDAMMTWRVSGPADRNVLLTALVEKIVVNENQVEILPRPDFAPNGSGDLRKRRDSNPRSRP